MPTDLWVPVTDRLKPMTADHYCAGAYIDLSSGWSFSGETYYKHMNNLLEYKDGENFIGSSKNWEDMVAPGKGRAFGAEFMIQRRVGRANGWIAYAWAKSDRKFGNSINRGERFPYKYDRRHSVDMVFNYKMSERVDFCANWKFYTGGTATVSVQQTEIIKPGGVTDSYAYIDKRNNFRLPSSQLLNIGFNFNKKKKHGIRTWNVSVYNVYNYMNPNVVYPDGDYYYSYGDNYFDNSYGQGGSYMTRKPKMKKLTVFPIIPSFTYTYKF